MAKVWIFGMWKMDMKRSYFSHFVVWKVAFSPKPRDDALQICRTPRCKLLKGQMTKFTGGH